MAGINFGDVLDRVAAARGNALALTADDRQWTWSELDARTNALARGLATLGVQRGDKVCFFLFNGSAYVELLAACFKAGYVHVNANFRYQVQELDYILENSDSVALVYDRRLAPVVDALPAARRAGVHLIQVGAPGDSVGGAVDFRALGEDEQDGPLAVPRSSEDLLFIYTGGTTGMPKGVMWTHHDQARILLSGPLGALGEGASTDDVLAVLDAPKGYERPLIASPLMHGLGFVTAVSTLCQGGHVVVTDNAGRFDAEHLWSLVRTHAIDGLSIVGDAFAKPLLAALDAGAPAPTTVRIIGSSGALWSAEVKQGLLSHLPGAAMYDGLASSEAMGLGSSVTTATETQEPAAFQVREGCVVFDEDWQEIPPGSGREGLLARSGPLPLGYYKDEAKTAETFRTVDGVRYSIPGDLCTVEADGTIRLLGRGSQCINTGGEKVYPEEVEVVLKGLPGVEDALVVGMPDPQWGQAVQAVVRALDGEPLDSEALRAGVRSSLAGYKVPKRVLQTEAGLRLANGKPDYRTAKRLLEEIA